MADKIACILGDGFEDSEFRVPYDRLQSQSFYVEIIGKQVGEVLTGKRGHEKVRAEIGIDDARVEDYDLLLIPGGHSPDHLRADPRFVAFVRDFDAAGKPIAAVCHGPQLFLSAGLQRGRTLTAWPTVQSDLREAGANVKDEQVVEDGNWITSRKPDDLQAFSDAIVRRLDTQLPQPGYPSPEPQPGAW
ncbi:MAG: type 1 glutamine amidotransferase [Deltaproteobacteria bacterium]|nr:type 1 glutamine amidotransferase [Deltaproteobacteria bacterium]